MERSFACNYACNAGCLWPTRLWEMWALIIDDGHLRHDTNNLTFTRLLLASSVIYSHCLWLITGSDRDRLAEYMGMPISTFAVDGFFFVSGFLVYRSLQLKPDLGRFALARFSRLWPGLAVMIAVVIFGGFWLTVTPTPEYIKLSLLYFGIKNLSFVYPHYMLPGVLCGFEPCNVNGSIWTIPWEVRCYLCLSLLFLLRLSGERMMIRFVLPLSAVYAVVCDIPPVGQFLHDHLSSGVMYYVGLWDRLWTAFALGIAAYIFRHRIPLRWSYLLIVLAIDVAVHLWLPAAGLHVRAILAGYLVLVLGFLTVKGHQAFSAAWPDLSYGIYIYAFPVMLILYRLGVDDLPALLVLDLVITALFAAASWYCVERPVLSWSKARSRRSKRTTAVGLSPLPMMSNPAPSADIEASH